MTTKQKLKSILLLIGFILSAILYSSNVEENDTKNVASATNATSTGYIINLNH
ncbi:hypothetical protein H0I23_04285 [Cellulophaga sp. HaHaR_3_176]|uniref:hypothetical protein n=1 Tax=Cellulophaga sp. HaHaR_3_176 TaxID=1942464 RepID=UPI001C1F4BEC|nr:hypothetical protein [Cellulophaga sp. HaHaR_3_176]QWX84868.1 hypothetical protein H0I23_04285 [Cellulophaga sp. HaHaR_3_176]